MLGPPVDLSLISLTDLLDALPRARLAGAPADEVHLTDVTHDSRQAGPGVLFACRPGERADGHDFAPAAVRAGAPALLVQRVLDLDVPQVVVADVATAMGPAAAAVHGHPSRALTLIGVTGTSGKTTTTYLLEGALRAAGHRTGLIGTIDGVRTTPESTDLQRLLRGMVDDGVTAVAMEVSSHGLALSRVAGTRFAAAGFTNLGLDHLDFHRDLADYEAAKAALFTPAYTDRAAVVVDGAAGQRIARAAAAAGLAVVRVSSDDATDVTLTPTGSTFTTRALPVTLQLPGAFNVVNALLALALADAVGVDTGVAAAGLGRLAGVPGRMERVEAGQPFTVLVDYAHKPDALENVLRAARQLTAGRVIVVIGAGGNRDPGKRPVMGRAAATAADLVVITDDNPRDEDPAAIRAAVERGAREVAGAHWTVVPDRRAAIAAAIGEAGPGDVVVIAGKGHERYQEVGGQRHPFDDREVARALLEQGVSVA